MEKYEWTILIKTAKVESGNRVAWLQGSVEEGGEDCQIGYRFVTSEASERVERKNWKNLAQFRREVRRFKYRVKVAQTGYKTKITTELKIQSIGRYSRGS